jgi:hypothetical protein
LELFSLEREGRPVAGRPFHLFFVAMLRIATHRPSFLDPNKLFCSGCTPLGAWSASRLKLLCKSYASLHTATVHFVLVELSLLLMQAARQVGIAAWRCGQNLSLGDELLQSFARAKKFSAPGCDG